jgi:2-polyprenyl-6-hydroxyphenyl methylase/3-demethylubiquinone-9 3-methyltransferase
MGLARTFIQYNRRLCDKLDRLLPEKFRVDGNTDFQRTFAPPYLKPDAVVYDVGGGKQPFVSEEQKRRLRLRIVGIDISREELERAPDGIYDRMIAEDIARFQGEGDADLVICQAVLEHVQDVDGAFRAMASSLRPGGTACVFVPSRNAVFARLNLLLPQAVKSYLLFTLFPGARAGQGFPSYYNQCTPDDFARLAREHDLEVTAAKHYYLSRYFTFFAPAHALWRAWGLSFFLLKGPQAAETFSIALRKNPRVSPNPAT